MLLELAIGDAYGAGFEYAPRELIRRHNTLSGYAQHKETSGLLVTTHWCERNRRVSVTLSPTLTLFLAPQGKLYLKLQERLRTGEIVHFSASPQMIALRKTT